MITSIVESAIKLGSELIEDKDQKNELALKTMEKLLDSKTYRWIDGLTKLAYASEQITKGLFRPIGSFCLTLFGMYCHVKGIDLGASHIAFDGAFIAWGASRHSEKAKAKPKEYGIEGLD